MVLGLESSSSRMSNLARQQMYFGRFFTVDDITAEVDRVTAEDIQRLATALIHSDKLALTLLGNLGPLKIDRDRPRLLTLNLFFQSSRPSRYP